MSIAIPKVSCQFGSVTPPQGDVLELRVHLGCTKEVSSFECLLQNFDKKYTVTDPINVGDNASISIGRGTGPGNCPLILTGRVEEVEPESTPVENHIRVRGRCLGEKIFRRVVTKTYENQKGEAVVKDLLDNYAGLGHVRDSTELVENTDTTYTLLEYENTPVFDILKYIAESADKSGVIGFDFRVEYDGNFAFFPRDSKTSPISLSEKIEHSRYSKDIHRVRNKIKVYGAAEKPYPLDTDGQPWSDSLTEDLTKPDNYLQHADGKWEPVTGNTDLYIETSTVHTGSKSIKLECTAYMYYMGIKFTFNPDKYVNCNLYPKLCFTLREDNNHNKKITISLEDKDGNVCRQILNVADYDEWQSYQLGVGEQNQESWTMSVFNSGPFDWENLRKVRLDFHQLSSKNGVGFIDRMHFGGCRWNATEEDSGSQTSYGLRELVEVDEELHSDNECSLRGNALLNHLSQPAEFLTLRTTCLDYGNERLLPGDKIHVTLPNENIDADYRIISVEYRVSARDQTLEITLELGKEKPLLADYLYGLRSTTITVEKLMRTKAGLTSVAGGGGGGGGGQVDEKVKVSSDDTTTDFLLQKLLAGTGITLSENNPGGDEKVKIDAHRKWSWADEQSWKKLINIPLGGNDAWTRYGGNPIFTKASPTAWDDDYVNSPCVLIVNDVIFLYYTGASPEQIGLATRNLSSASDLYGPFTRYANNPIISKGSWTRVTVPYVIYDEYESDANKRWKMWMTIQDGATYKIGRSYSSDGYSWDTPTILTTPSDFLFGTPVLRLGNFYHMAYGDTSNEISLLVSKDDFTNQTEMGKLLSLGSAGQWDDTRARYNSVFWNLGVWYLFYAATDGTPYSSYPWSVGIAISTTGGMVAGDTTFKKWRRNPVLQKAGAVWDKNVLFPSLLMYENKFYMYYTGLQNWSPRDDQIGLATVP